MSKWSRLWRTSKYITAKRKNFEIVDNYLANPPKCILDIGCGFAYESQMFQEKYACDVYLLEGERNNNRREIKYGNVDDFKFYSYLYDLKSHWDSQGISYNFLDANNPVVKHNVIFDVVYSFLSCGYHYPAHTYKNLIVNHTDNNSKIIMDIRNSNKQDIEIIDIIVKEAKSQKAVIKFID